jgi:WD40 repeat protein
MPPDASWIATVDRSPSHTCQVWDGRTGELLSSIGIKIRMQSVAASPDGRLLALGLNDLGVREKNKILLCDPRTGQVRSTLATRVKDLNSTAFSPDGRLLAAGFRGQLQLWDVETASLRRIITGHERQLWRLAFSPDGSLIAAGATDGFIWIWRVADGREHLVINTGGRTVKGLAFSPDGRTLASLFSGTPVRLWAVPPFDDNAP